jgi:hypothetical protein
VVDVTAIANSIAGALPLSARWTIETTPLDFNFSVGHAGLRELASFEDNFGDILPNASLVFGEYDYSEGGGAHAWLCIRKTDGWVCGIDLEREEPEFIFNSSIARFCQTFVVLNRYLEVADPARLPACCETEIAGIDPEAYPTSDWKLLVAYVLDA